MPFSLWNERNQGQSSRVTRRGGGRRKSDDLSTGSSRQKGDHALEKFERGSSVWIKPAFEPDPGKILTRKKERKKSEN